MIEVSINELEHLRTALRAAQADYALLSPLPGTLAHARFIGPFAGRDVLWDMQLMTLARYAQMYGRPTAEGLRGLMHIAPGSEHAYRLEVALNVPLIDEPSLRKTIVMMRNYKQLRLGLRTWPEPMADTGGAA